MREMLEAQPNLKTKQAEVTGLILDEEPARIALGISLRDGRNVSARAVIITTGTLPERPHSLRGTTVPGGTLR